VSESHLARSLFSQPAHGSVRKKVVSKAGQKSDNPNPAPGEMPTAQPNPDPHYAELQANYAQLQNQYETLQLDLNRSIELNRSLQSSLEAQIQQCQQQAEEIQALRQEKVELEAKLARLEENGEHPQLQELQAQIAQKHQQLQEAQATIQHWREQALKHHQHAIQLSGALERLLADKPSPKATPPTVSAPVPVEKPIQRTQVELPSFLTRSR
jgi:DNA repair exonuclease SbcCD ATPase subunit